MISMISNFQHSIDKYGQWKHLISSSIVMIIINLIIMLIMAIVLPVSIAGSLAIVFCIFIWYWNRRLKKLKSNGCTKNSKYWGDREFWYNLSGWKFEEEVADVFSKCGFKTTVTKGSGDGGVDIIMYRDNLKYIVQCKNYRGHSATPQELRALWGVKDDFKADCVIMVASDGISEMGMQYIANKQGYRILTLTEILALVNLPQQISVNKNTVSKPKSKLVDNIILALAVVMLIIFTTACYFNLNA